MLPSALRAASTFIFSKQRAAYNYNENHFATAYVAALYEKYLPMLYKSTLRFVSLQVCDHTCGSGRFGNNNCDWRGYGENCRYCFENTVDALGADKLAQIQGGRVIM